MDCHLRPPGLHRVQRGKLGRDVFEAEFTFNTSESFSKDLAVIAAIMALAYGVAKLWKHKSRGKVRDGRG